MAVDHSSCRPRRQARVRSQWPAARTTSCLLALGVNRRENGSFGIGHAPRRTVPSRRNPSCGTAPAQTQHAAPMPHATSIFMGRAWRPTPSGRCAVDGYPLGIAASREGDRHDRWPRSIRRCRVVPSRRRDRSGKPSPRPRRLRCSDVASLEARSINLHIASHNEAHGAVPLIDSRALQIAFPDYGIWHELIITRPS
jgi:hypothetical protein